MCSKSSAVLCGECQQTCVTNSFSVLRLVFMRTIQEAYFNETDTPHAHAHTHTEVHMYLIQTEKHVMGDLDCRPFASTSKRKSCGLRWSFLRMLQIIAPIQRKSDTKRHS